MAASYGSRCDLALEIVGLSIDLDRSGKVARYRVVTGDEQ